MSKLNVRSSVICILLAIAFGAGGLYAGRAAGLKAGRTEAEAAFQKEREQLQKEKAQYQTEAETSQAEKELDILIHRSELEGLGEPDGPIYVTGHKSPDSDTVCSSIAYAALLQQLGYDAVPVVLGDINNETQYILSAAGLERPMLLEDAAGCNMVLVDHSELAQSAEGLQDAHIITIIDHHGDGSVTTGNQLIYDARPVGAAATIVWIRYRDYGIEPDQKTAMALLGAVLSDTSNLKSKNTTTADREALKALSSLAGVTDLDSFYRELYKASISYDGKTDEEIYQSDLREYEAGGIKYMIGCVEAYDEETAEDLAARMKEVILDAMEAAGADMAYAQVSIFHDDISISYIVPSDDAAAGVIEEAFGDRAVFDGTSYVLNPGVSRRQVLVPAITDVLESHPRE